MKRSHRSERQKERSKLNLKWNIVAALTGIDDRPRARWADEDRADREAKSPLFVAINRHDPEGVREALREGADPNGKNDNNKSALAFALWRLTPECAEILLRNGADPKKSGDNVSDLLISCIRDGYTDVTRSLVTRLEDIDERNQNGRTSFHIAAENNRTDIMNMLIVAGADKEARTRGSKKTALILSAENGNADAVNLLLWSRVSVNAEDRNGETALDAAKRAGHDDIAAALVSAGAKPGPGRKTPRPRRAARD